MKATAAQTVKLYAISRSGKTLAIEVATTENSDVITDSEAILRENGFTDSDLDGLILSPNEPAPAATAPARQRIVVASADKLGTGPYPPIPKPANKDDHTPAQSETILVSMTAANDLFVYASKQKKYLPTTGKNAYCDPKFPTRVTLAYYRYWRNVGSYTLTGPQSYTYQMLTTEGMSVTNETSFSGEFGIEVSGLSAKLSMATSQSITVSAEHTVSDQYTIDVREGEVCVYTLWQLDEVFTFLNNTDPDLPVTWKGTWSKFPGFPMCSARFPNNLSTNNASVYVSDPVYFPA